MTCYNSHQVCYRGIQGHVELGCLASRSDIQKASTVLDCRSTAPRDAQRIAWTGDILQLSAPPAVADATPSHRPLPRWPSASPGPKCTADREVHL